MINILPYNQKRMVDKVRRLRLVTSVLWGATLLVGVAGVLAIPTILTIKSRYHIAESQVALFEESGVVAKAVDVAALDARVDSAYAALAAVLPPPPTVYIDTIRALVPAGIDISSFTLGEGDEGTVIHVEGVANTRAQLQAFITTLEKEATVAAVDSPVSNFVKSTNGSFTMRITFKK